MRINVYSQEITNELAFVMKRAENGPVYYGVRMYLASPDILHHTPDDDDRSAITFWIPHKCKSFDANAMSTMFSQLAHMVREAQLLSKQEEVK